MVFLDSMWRQSTQTFGKCVSLASFQYNKKSLADNLQETPLTSLRSVYDEIAQHGSVRSFPIGSLLITCQSTGTKF